MSKNAARQSQVVVRSVEVVFQFPGDVRTIVSVQWQRGLTVLAASQTGGKNIHGPVLTVVGTGKFAFVCSIDDESEVRQTRYWMYSVNGEFPNEGCNAREVQPGDIVRWELIEFDPDLAKSR